MTKSLKLTIVCNIGYQIFKSLKDSDDWEIFVISLILERNQEKYTPEIPLVFKNGYQYPVKGLAYK